MTPFIASGILLASWARLRSLLGNHTGDIESRKTTSCCGRLAATRNMPRPDNWPRTILHVDLDAFYTSVHQRDDVKLRGIPVAVAGRSRRALAICASYEARAFRVRSAKPPHQALQLCPPLMGVTPDR